MKKVGSMKVCHTGFHQGVTDVGIHGRQHKHGRLLEQLNGTDTRVIALEAKKHHRMDKTAKFLQQQPSYLESLLWHQTRDIGEFLDQEPEFA